MRKGRDSVPQPIQPIQFIRIKAIDAGAAARWWSYPARRRHCDRVRTIPSSVKTVRWRCHQTCPSSVTSSNQVLAKTVPSCAGHAKP